MKIRAAMTEDAGAWNRMRMQLWPGESHNEEIAAFFAGAAREPVAVFFAEQDDGSLAGFAEVSVRHDYVEGASSSPVAYLEGWFVEPGMRGRRIGKHLLAFAEAWAANSGYTEFGSDVALDNQRSLRAHLSSGCRISGTAIHLIKSIGQNSQKAHDRGSAT